MKALELIKKMCTFIQEYGDCDITIVSTDEEGYYGKTDYDVSIIVETNKNNVHFRIY